MQDYTFEYSGDSYRIPKSKIFECLYAVGEIVPILSISSVFESNDFMKAAKIFSVMFSYTGKEINPLDVTKHYLHEKGGAVEIFTAINGALVLLNPPETYHPVESEEAGK